MAFKSMQVSLGSRRSKSLLIIHCNDLLIPYLIFRTAHAVLEAVKEALTTYMTTHITIAGHSLGAAIGILDATFLSLQLPKSVSFKFIGYGMPRVGDPAFAAYLDGSLSISILPLSTRLILYPH